jgi:glycosyltransferase involved in cell wall biosynthesis
MESMVNKNSSTNTPKVSVAIGTYNHEKFIAATLKSVLSQETNFSFEIIVGDDYSTDFTRAIIKGFVAQFPEKIIPLFYDGKVGGNENYINIYDACKGEYIAHLDGDDLMLPGKLQKQINFLDTHPECAISGHSMNVINSAGESRPFKTNPSQMYDLDYLVKNGCSFVHSSKVFRKNAIPPEGMDCSASNVGDFLWHIQNAQYGKVGYLGEVLGTYRKHTQGNSFRNGSRRDHIIGVFKDLMYSIDYAEGHGASKEACEQGRSRVYFQCAVLFLRKKELDLFKMYMEGAKNYARLSVKGRVIWSLRKTPKILYWLTVPYYFLLSVVFYR